MSNPSTPPNVVEDGRVTYRANDSVENIRESVGLPAVEPAKEPVKAEPVADEEADAQPEKARNDDGTFKAKADEPKAKDGDPRKSIQGKINAEVARRAEAERRAEAAERRAAEAEARAVQANASPAAPVADKIVVSATPSRVELIKQYQQAEDWPKLADFLDAGFDDPYAACNAAQAAYIGEKQDEQRQERSRAAAKESAFQTQLRTTLDRGAEKYADWHDLMQTPAASVELPGVVLNELLSDPDLSADLMHHLLSNPAELDAMALVRDPIAAARAIAKLSVRLTAAPSGPASDPLPITRAKPLIKPVSSSPQAPTATPPDELPFGPRYIQEMNAKERKEREGRRA